MGRKRKRLGAEPRTLTIELPEPVSFNDLLRMYKTGRGTLYAKHRNRLEMLIRAQRPRGWQPLQRFEVSARFRLFAYRDPWELPACLKAEIDAAIRAGIIEDDGYRHLVPTVPEQVVDRTDRGVTITFREIIDEQRRAA